MRCGTIQQTDPNDWSDRNSLDMNRPERRDRPSHRKALIEVIMIKTIRTGIWKPSFIFNLSHLPICANSIQFNSTHFHELLVNSETFKLSLNLSPTHLRAQSACYELKGDLSPLILNEIFHDSLKISKFTRICMENHSSVTWWQKLFFLIQILLIFDDRCNRCFWDTRLKMYRLPNFNLLLQLMVTKFFKSELFSCLSKVDHVIT